MCTEKIDGTNIRIMWDGRNVTFGGKTDNAQIPKPLLEVLQNTFTSGVMDRSFPSEEGVPLNVCMYGEGYGAKIQKGRNYLSNRVSFILFDIMINDWWLVRETNERIAEQMCIDIVPVIGIMTLGEAVEYVKKGYKSTIAENKGYIAEGLIMKPVVELFNRKGERVISKIKYKDFVR